MEHLRHDYMRHTAKRLTVAICSCVAVVILFTCPNEANNGILNGLTLCANIVIPSLFPFMVLSGFISRTSAADTISKPLSYVLSPLFKIPKGACASVLLSFISGYPVGAATVAQLHRRGIIDSKTASRMLAFSINSGPAMVVLAVGGKMFGSIKLGWILYASHIGASVIIGAVSARFADKVHESKTFPVFEPPAYAFVNSTAAACNQMLVICGYVVLFAAITELLKSFAPWAIALAEVTCGAAYAVESGLSVPIVSAILGFSGISVMCQVLSLSDDLISPVKLLIARTVHAGISFLLCTILIKLIPDAVTTMSNSSHILSGFNIMTVPVTLSMLLMACVMLLVSASKS